MKIPSHSDKYNSPPKIEEQGDTVRDMLSARTLAPFVTVRSLLKANDHNEISRLHKIPKNDRFRGAYFKGAAVKQLPSAGDTDLAALPVFRDQMRKGGYAGVKNGHPIRRHSSS